MSDLRPGEIPDAADGMAGWRSDPKEWPQDALFAFGDRVRRKDSASGKPPAYRFPGSICGWYRQPNGGLGFAISNAYEPACIQIFPQSTLELQPDP